MTSTPQPGEGRRAPFLSGVILRAYTRLGTKSLQAALRSWSIRLEGGPALSLTIRDLYQRHHGLTVGLYTAGPCLVPPNRFHIGTAFGRYATIAPTVRTFTRNHTSSTMSTSGFFDNPVAGVVESDLIPWGNLRIGHGAWIGHQAIILPPTDTIGEGAVVTPGSVVYTNVPPYAIVSGFPARVMGYRHPKETIARLLDSRWWESSPAELQRNAEAFRTIHASATPTGPSPNA